jgi:hypothetical protein
MQLALQSAGTNFWPPGNSLQLPPDNHLPPLPNCELTVANDPELPVGQGRFCKLTERAAQLFYDTWQQDGG